MKKIVILALCFFAAANLEASRIVDIYRSKGLFGFYGTIRQTYMGTLNGEPWWELYCSDWGVNKCKLRPTAGRTVRQAEIEELENIKLSDLMVSIENEEVNNGHETGTLTKHYKSTLSDNSVVDLYIVINWKSDPNNANNTLFHATLSNSEE